MSGQWWETFFDDAYIDLWTHDGAFADTEQDVESLIQLLRLRAGASILDLPCGFGRFAQPLHDRGFEVTGVDASTEQIRVAMDLNHGPTYLIGDMRQPPPGPFDAVINLYSSFGYFDDSDDDLRCLHAWRDVLRPGGVVILETMHRDRLAWQHGSPRDPGGRGEDGVTDWVTGVRTSLITVGGQRRMFRVRLYTVTQLVEMFIGAGFVEVEAFGTLAAEPIDPSKRLVIRATRA